MVFLLQPGHISCHTKLSAHLTFKAQTCSGVTYDISLLRARVHTLQDIGLIFPSLYGAKGVDYCLHPTKTLAGWL